MTHSAIQLSLVTVDELLEQARVHYETSEYDAATQCVHKALEIVEPLINRSDLGDQQDSSSLLYRIIKSAAYAYNRLNVIEMDRSHYDLSLHYAKKAIPLCEQIGDYARKAGLIVNIGSVYYYLSDNVLALEYYNQALILLEELDNKIYMSNVLNNIGAVYQSLNNHQKSLEYINQALAIDEELGNMVGVASSLGNIGIAYKELSDYPRAVEYMKRGLHISEQIGNKNKTAIGYGNIGIVCIAMSDYSQALVYLNKALELYEKMDIGDGIAFTIGNIGTVYAEPNFVGYDPVKAEELLKRAIALSIELGTKQYHRAFYKTLANFYEKNNQWQEAHEYFKKFYEVESLLHNEEAQQTANLMEQRRNAADREKQIELERIRATAEKQILNNILPEDITKRLINGENPIADTFECVSVLFMDIVDFTTLSTKISAQQLVHLLNAIFSAADGVMREFGLEKIKTIGDAYMAVAGAPVAQKDHAERATYAALKLLDVMKNLVVSFHEELGDRTWIESLPEIEVRIGLHCGSVAAGVVGENKFLYDLWGDAVNTAARMESHGEAGKIHVSEEFVQELSLINSHASPDNGATTQLTNDRGLMTFIPRGDINIKGKGSMKTYFLERG